MVAADSEAVVVPGLVNVKMAILLPPPPTPPKLIALGVMVKASASASLSGPTVLPSFPVRPPHAALLWLVPERDSTHGYLHLSVAKPLPAPATLARPDFKQAGGSAVYE